MPTTELIKVAKTRYFGVKCATCEEPIPLTQYEPDERKTVAFFVPVTPVPCPYCGSSHLYASPDALHFDSPDDLILSGLA